METYQVKGTTFRMETLPDDVPPFMHKRQAELLAKAEAVKPYRRRSYPTPFTPMARQALKGRPNTLTTNPPKPVGWYGKINNDGTYGTVQFAGPQGGAWCVTDDGQWVLARKHGPLQPAVFGHAARLQIVHELIKREIAGSDHHADGFQTYIPAAPPWGKPLDDQQRAKFTAALERQHRIETQLALWAWEHLYPSHPVPVDELINLRPTKAEES